jgi:hypothetical protein
MPTLAENTDFSGHDAIYAWPAIIADMQAAPPAALADAADFSTLADDAKAAPTDHLMAAAFMLAFLLGNALFDWFAPVCSVNETALVGGGVLLAFCLLLRHPLLALTLAFCIGDPAMDVYGHCLMGL